MNYLQTYMMAMRQYNGGPSEETLANIAAHNAGEEPAEPNESSGTESEEELGVHHSSEPIGACLPSLSSSLKNKGEEPAEPNESSGKPLEEEFLQTLAEIDACGRSFSAYNQAKSSHKNKGEEPAEPNESSGTESEEEPTVCHVVCYAPGKMTYKVSIYTGGQAIYNCFLTLNSNKLSGCKTLVKGKSEEIIIDVTETKDLKNITLVKLEIGGTPWYCKLIKVKAPSGKIFEFPCYRWMTKSEVVIREGSARLPQDEKDFLIELRKEELKSRQKTFRWTEWKRSFPLIIDGKRDNLHQDVQFDKEKHSHFFWTTFKAFATKTLNWFHSVFQSWEDLDDFQQIMTSYCLDNTLLEKVIQDWNTDYMFGYQFLNGCNPVMISKCVELPKNFPVKHKMVKGFLQRGLTLEEEIEKGNIYIANYEILEGLEVDTSNYMTAPICLLYNNRLNQIVPIAIQLKQTPGKTSPIFLPSDDEYDWILAKMCVKSADFSVHQLVTHLLQTHLISEVFEVAIYRQLSAVHPVYKLLMPHVRSTIAINDQARKNLINKTGVFIKVSSLSAKGTEELMKRAMEKLDFKSLCFPEAIEARGMKDAPKYYYRDDGMKVWKTIKQFVRDVVKIYYDSDEAILKDVEIQKFVEDVAFGLRDESNKFPTSLKSKKELIQYLTAVIFTSSAQHAAINFGQFEWYGWIPNSPSTMRKSPPIQKGTVDMEKIMEYLPDRECSGSVLATVWSLSQFQENELFLGTYPDMYFTEQAVKEAIKTFRKNLDDLTDQIKSRNKTLTMEYRYLSPDRIPNSVAI